MAAAFSWRVAKGVFLVGDGDGEAGEIKAGVVEEGFHEGLEGFVGGFDEEGEVEAVEAGGVESGVVDGGGHGVGDGLGDDAEDLGGRADLVPAVEGFHVGDGRLAGGGAAWGREGGEGEEAAELLAEDSADEAGLAHAEGDGGFLAGLEQVEGFEVVANGAGSPDDLVNRVGQGVELREEVVEARGAAGEVVGR